MSQKITSEDNWLVQCLFLASFGAALFFGVSSGWLATHLGVTASANPMVAQVSQGSVISVSNDQEFLQALISATGGETISLRPGTYGSVLVRGDQYAKTIVGSFSVSGKTPQLSASRPLRIVSENLSNRAVVQAFNLHEFGNVQIEGVSIRPSANQAAVSLRGVNNIFTKNDISYGDATDWTAEQWLAAVGKKTALSISGENSVASYNYLKNVGHGIVAGNGVHVHHNIVDQFSADGIRGLGDNSIIEHNLVTGPIKVDGNHDDGFQSWSRGADGKVGTGVVRNVQLRHNTFLAIPDGRNLRAGMQGIGMFDGFFQDWVIENNLVLTPHYHGISVYGAIDVVIQNNVALDVTADRPGPMWVRFFNHKNGTASVGGSVINNITNRPTPVEGNTAVAWSEYGLYFVNHLANDFTFKPGVIPFAVGAQIDMSKMAPEPFKSGTSPATPVITEPIETEEPSKRILPEADFTISNLKPVTGEAVTFDASRSTDATSYKWDDAVGQLGQWPLGEGERITFTFEKPGVKQVRLTVTNEYGSDSMVIPLEVTDAVGEDPLIPDEPVVDDAENPVVDEPIDKDPVVIDTTTRIQTTANLKVRQSPNGLHIATVRVGSQGVRSNQPAVKAGNFDWIFVTFDNGVSGYVAEHFTNVVPVTSSNVTTESDIQALEEQIAQLLKIVKALQAQLNRLQSNQ